MEISTFIVTYSSIWCVLFLMALPIRADKEQNIEGQPVTIKKIIYITLLSLPVTFAVISLIMYVAQQ